MITEEERKLFLLEYRLKWLKECTQMVAQDLARAALSNYTPSSLDLLNHAKWLHNADNEIEYQGKRILLEVTGK